MSYPKIVTRDELVNLLSQDAGAKPIGFVARTKVGGSKGLNKKNRDTGEPNPFGEVWKVAKVSGWVNISYARAVEKETGEPYVPGEVWHDAALDVNDKLTPFAEHPETHKLYLRVVRPKTGESVYESSTVGKVDFSDLKPYVSPPQPERPIAFRTYGLEGIVSVNFDGHEVLVVDNIIEVRGAA